jgi:CRISPR type III-B/RAMP module RAMP protein Cmr6
LDRLFGFPFIPGSAVKGVARHAALADLKAAEGEERQRLFDVFRSVFGTADNDFTNGQLRQFRPLLGGRPMDRKGGVAFLPAYPINEAKIVVDLTNVHYPDYYRSGRAGDLSREKPRPNPFPAVETGAQFAFCIVTNGMCEEPGLLGDAARWLETALTIRGVGAKTASGYGWLSLHPEVLDEIEAKAKAEADAAAKKAAEAAEAKRNREKEVKRKASLAPEERAREDLEAMPDQDFANFAKNLAERSEPEQRAFFSLVGSDAEKKKRLKTWKKKKPDLYNSIEEIRTQLESSPQS